MFYSRMSQIVFQPNSVSLLFAWPLRILKSEFLQQCCHHLWATSCEVWFLFCESLICKFQILFNRFACNFISIYFTSRVWLLMSCFRLPVKLYQPMLVMLSDLCLRVVEQKLMTWTQILCTQIARHVNMLAAGYLFSLCICSRVVSVQNGPGSNRSRDAVW